MDDRSHQVLAVALLFLILSWITVSLRIYVRAGMLKSFGMDDWTMLVTQLLFTTYLICQIGGVAHGTGKHMWDLKPESATKALHYWYLCELFYILASCTLKVSIGLFLLRVAGNKLHIWIIRSIFVGTAVFGTGYFFVALLQCNPIHDFWKLTPHSGSCMNPRILVGISYVATVINALADWVFGILPIFIVRTLAMPKRQKILVAGILAFAAIGSTATVVRIPFIHGLGETGDFLWTTVDIAIWSTVEPGVGISAGCIATLRPLLSSVLRKAGLGSSHQLSGPLGGRPTNAHQAQQQQRLGYPRARHALDDSFGCNEPCTITSISGPNGAPGGKAGLGLGSRESEEEMLAKGISRNVVITCSDVGRSGDGLPPEGVDGARKKEVV